MNAVIDAPTSPLFGEQQSLRMSAVDWNQYEQLGTIFLDHPGLRMTYDGGTLEFMTLSNPLERFKEWLGRFVETLAEERGLDLEPGGSTTLRSRFAQKGMEPDLCYWISGAAVYRDQSPWSADTGPVPDLVVEIEVSRSLMDRLSILAALKVPEVWRLADHQLSVWILGEDGVYAESAHSLAFSALPVREIAAFLPDRFEGGFQAAVRAVRSWVRSLA